MRIILTLVWILLASSLQAANGFYTQRLEKMAKVLNLSASSPTGEKYANGKLLRIRTNTYGDISHIGYKLFNDEIMQLHGESPVFDFIERYMLELDMRLDGRSPLERMNIDQVVISKGNLQMLRAIDTNTEFSINELKRRMYQVTWTVKGKKVEITFPADCQLLIGANAVELENMMKRDINRIMPLTSNDIITDWTYVKTTRSQGHIIVEGGKYLSNQIRGDIYLQDIHGKKQLICNRKNARNSITNIMLTGQFQYVIPMHLRIDKYGYKAEETDITLQQFIDYCKNEGCKLYFGIKTINETTLTGTLFAYNEKMAYNHVLSVSIPLNILDGKKEKINATVYAYIPLQNVTEKFFTQDIHEEAPLRKSAFNVEQTKHENKKSIHSMSATSCFNYLCTDQQ